MVSHRPPFAIAAIPEAGRRAHLMPKIFHWSNGFSSTAVRYCGYPGGRVASTSRAKNISLVQWFLIDHCSLLHQFRRPGDKHFSCHKYFTGPMVSHRVEDQTSSEATSVPSWKWKGWAESIHALLEQKTLFAHFTPNCGAQMVPVLKGVYRAESGEVPTQHCFQVRRRSGGTRVRRIIQDHWRASDCGNMDDGSSVAL
jgi:hypothetical protein